MSPAGPAREERAHGPGQGPPCCGGRDVRPCGGRGLGAAVGNSRCPEEDDALVPRGACGSFSQAPGPWGPRPFVAAEPGISPTAPSRGALYPTGPCLEPASRSLRTSSLLLHLAGKAALGVSGTRSSAPKEGSHAVLVRTSLTASTRPLRRG